MHSSDETSILLLDRILELTDDKLIISDSCLHSSKMIFQAFSRLVSLFKSFAAMETDKYGEAGSVITGIMLELFMNIKILHTDDTGTMANKYVEYFEVQKFRAAHRILSFSDDAGEQIKIDVADYKHFMSESGGIDEIRKKVIDIWGADNREKASYPVHWSGRKCTRVMAHELGPEIEELYIRAYSIPNWHINCERLETTPEDAPRDTSINDWLHGTAQLILVETAIIILNMGDDNRENSFLNEAAAVLRNSPGKPLPLSFFD